MNSQIEGVAFSLKQNDEHTYIAIHSEKSFYTLNSSVWGGGFGYHHVIVNRQVHKSYYCDDPIEEMHQFLILSGELPEDTAGMLTAAYVRDVGNYAETLTWSASPSGDGLETLSVSSWSTVGLGNTARAGVTKDQSLLFPGTINIIVVIEGNLTDSAMVNAVITATEAKTAVLEDLGIKAKNEAYGATGTTTDAIVIASTQMGRKHDYAGTATKLGYLIGKTVYEATKASALLYFKEIGQSI
jgi:adenosylcobinamide hydrolase